MIGFCKDCDCWMRNADDALRGKAGVVTKARCGNWESSCFPSPVASSNFCDSFRVLHNPSATGKTTGYAARTGAVEVRQA